METVTPFAPPAAKPMRTKPVPNRSKRRWLFVVGFMLSVLALPFICLIIADRWREYELTQIYREMDAEDPNWRWADLVAAIPSVADEENAIAQIRKVSELLAKTPFALAPAWSTPGNVKRRDVCNAKLSPEDVALLRAAFQPLDPRALAEARKLKDFPKGYIKIDPALNYYFELNGDDLARALEAAQLLDCDIQLRTHSNDMEGAAESWHALLNVSHAIGELPSAISKLIRMNRQQIALAALERLLGQGEWMDDDLANFQTLLKRETNDNLLYHGLRGERAGSHQMYLDLRDGKESVAVGKLLREFNAPPSWEHPSLSKAYPEHMRLFNEYVRAAKLKDEDGLEAIRKIDQKVRDNRSSFMTRVFMPGTARITETHYRTHAQLRCAMAAVACERYRVKHDAWPRDFDDLLKERWLDAIPKDPYDGKPLRFKRTAIGVIIYTVGLDKIDNQGKLDRNTPNAPGTDTGFEVWDHHLRAIQPAVEIEKRP